MLITGLVKNRRNLEIIKMILELAEGMDIYVYEGKCEQFTKSSDFLSKYFKANPAYKYEDHEFAAWNLPRDVFAAIQAEKAVYGEMQRALADTSRWHKVRPPTLVT